MTHYIIISLASAFFCFVFPVGQFSRLHHDLEPVAALGQREEQPRYKHSDMYYWMKRSGAAPEGLDHMSRAEILRGIVTEKLTTAAEEILAVVERTVAGYEEEASGFRREIARQRRQLEAVLQPRVKLERRGQKKCIRKYVVRFMHSKL